MKALIINGCNNFGKSIILNLIDKGYDIIVTHKNKKQLEFFQNNLGKEIETICLDLSSNYNCKKLFNKYSKDDIDLVINCTNDNYNNDFLDEKLDRDLDLIDTNIVATHVLTKLFLKHFEEKNKGYILNIIPNNTDVANYKMATYMASKAYILKLMKSINYELVVKKSNIYVGIANTGFINVDKNKDYTNEAENLINQLFQKKFLILV